MQLSVAIKPTKLKAVTQRTVGQRLMDQLRAIYASRKLTQAKVEQQSGGTLKQSSVSRLLKGSPADPGIDKVIFFAQALDVDFVALVADTMGSHTAGQTVVAELEALRSDVGRIYERLDAALEARADPGARHGRPA